MKRVVIESPYAGDVERNTAYARACMADCLHRGEAPYASHLLYTQPGVLDDSVPDERRLGITAGLVWGEVADLVAVYVDLGITAGMRLGMERHQERGVPVEERRLGGVWAGGGVGRLAGRVNILEGWFIGQRVRVRGPAGEEPDAPLVSGTITRIAFELACPFVVELDVVPDPGLLAWMPLTRLWQTDAAHLHKITEEG